MSVSGDLDDLADFYAQCAQQALKVKLKLGPKPRDEAGALLWEQQVTRLQGQINSFSALVSKLTAAAVLASLQDYAVEIQQVAKVAKAAKAKIAGIERVSALLTTLAAVLDLGLAVLAAAATPSLETIGAVVSAGTALKDLVDKTDDTAPASG
ncbi:hypothetical protein [Rhizobium sp. SGZ-381]|uniref:hypothetical protein n=1 Tax=Rhizobium sp. SGZ-381 TaxID=3342800 RepID=UPI0036726FC7